jgi:bis(5'-nucleosyl)-tetraphosphatase (symmetrical)
MATYVIGDIQGCHTTLLRLVERLRFDPVRDRLWFVGDLVNRGPASAEVLRWVRGLGDRAMVVLGNHDLHLLARARGLGRAKRRDTFQDVLEAPDRDVLLEWLRARPLIHREESHLLVHAGLLPAWTVAEAEELARAGEEVLRGDDATEFLACLEERPDHRWDDSLSQADRLLVAVLAMTCLRACTPGGDLDLSFSGPPRAASPGYQPWFTAPGRKSTNLTVLFGHWSTLGLFRDEGVIGLDTGCVWGGSLTALRLEDGRVFQEQLADEVRVDP